MYIAVCDENPAHRRELIDVIRSTLSKEVVSHQIKEYARPRDLLYDVQDGEYIDAVFIDVTTTGGWESVLSLRELCFEGFIVLMSDCEKYMLEGYAVEASGYLTKPFLVQSVNEVMVRICSRVNKACLTLHYHARIVRVPYHEILYIESCNAKCMIHRIDHEEYTLYAHLDDLEKELRDERFLRCHQSYLVNMDHVVAADKQFVMSNGDVVSIRQRELRRLRERYREYVCLMGRR